MIVYPFGLSVLQALRKKAVRVPWGMDDADPCVHLVEHVLPGMV